MYIKETFIGEDALEATRNRKEFIEEQKDGLKRQLFYTFQADCEPRIEYTVKYHIREHYMKPQFTGPHYERGYLQLVGVLVVKLADPDAVADKVFEMLDQIPCNNTMCSREIERWKDEIGYTALVEKEEEYHELLEGSHQ